MKYRNLEVSIARSPEEIHQALLLRYEVFKTELNKGLAQSTDIHVDRDSFDEYCEHLIVTDRDSHKVVGTYRILLGSTAEKGPGFYSETEFVLSPFYCKNHSIMEIGRSCVDRDYRDGSVITLLWRGLANCIIMYNIRYLIGCASMHTMDAREVSEIYGYFRIKNFLADQKYLVVPRNGFALNGFDSNKLIGDPKDVLKKIPAIIKGYLRAGARICGEPAVDSAFGTVDVFVLFDADKITQSYKKKFMDNSRQSSSFIMDSNSE